MELIEPRPFRWTKEGYYRLCEAVLPGVVGRQRRDARQPLPEPARITRIDVLRGNVLAGSRLRAPRPEALLAGLLHVLPQHAAALVRAVLLEPIGVDQARHWVVRLGVDAQEKAPLAGIDQRRSVWSQPRAGQPAFAAGHLLQQHLASMDDEDEERFVARLECHGNRPPAVASVAKPFHSTPVSRSTSEASEFRVRGAGITWGEQSGPCRRPRPSPSCPRCR
jgi:hypothetical protein